MCDTKGQLPYPNASQPVRLKWIDGLNSIFVYESENFVPADFVIGYPLLRLFPIVPHSPAPAAPSDGPAALRHVHNLAAELARLTMGMAAEQQAAVWKAYCELQTALTPTSQTNSHTEISHR